MGTPNTNDSIEFPLTLPQHDVKRLLESTAARVIVHKPIDMGNLYVVPRRDVGPDWPMMNPRGVDPVKSGNAVRAGMNPQGAVFAIRDKGKTLGLKPGEFDFVCPYVIGATCIARKDSEWVDSMGSAPVWTVWSDVRCKAWVRETWRPNVPCPIHDAGDMGEGRPCFVDGCECTLDLVDYQATTVKKSGKRWRPSHELPRWASRIVRQVMLVNVVRHDEMWMWRLHIRGGRPWDKEAT